MKQRKNTRITQIYLTLFLVGCQQLQILEIDPKCGGTTPGARLHRQAVQAGVPPDHVQRSMVLKEVYVPPSISGSTDLTAQSRL